ncbi:unnamed protein product [Protopolystoma xenopodis]|uniref:Uncharacterized protein n=1 Tax=Protopolystoma xenopodis TaxID=117903 RepID=A0A3S5BDD4_9PLAT|nr:unnamed protein product [Protopolystoma xenopodis]
MAVSALYYSLHWPIIDLCRPGSIVKASTIDMKWHLELPFCLFLSLFLASPVGRLSQSRFVYLHAFCSRLGSTQLDSPSRRLKGRPILLLRPLVCLHLWATALVASTTLLIPAALGLVNRPQDGPVSSTNHRLLIGQAERFSLRPQTRATTLALPFA